MSDKGRVMMLPERDVKRMTKADYRIAMLESRVAQLERALSNVIFCVREEIYDGDLITRREMIEKLRTIYPCKDFK